MNRDDHTMRAAAWRAEPNPPWKRMRPPPPPAAPSRSERLQARLDEIGLHHHQDDRAGGRCVECSKPWPCRTYLWASEDRDPQLDPWDSADDERDMAGAGR